MDTRISRFLINLGYKNIQVPNIPGIQEYPGSQFTWDERISRFLKYLLYMDIQVPHISNILGIQGYTGSYYTWYYTLQGYPGSLYTRVTRISRFLIYLGWKDIQIPHIPGIIQGYPGSFYTKYIQGLTELMPEIQVPENTRHTDFFVSYMN